MATSTQPIAGQPATSSPPTDAGIKVLARALKQKREEAEALVRLVEQATLSSDKGQNVNYYG